MKIFMYGTPPHGILVWGAKLKGFLWLGPRHVACPILVVYFASPYDFVLGPWQPRVMWPLLGNKRIILICYFYISNIMKFGSSLSLATKLEKGHESKKVKCEKVEIHAHIKGAWLWNIKKLDRNFKLKTFVLT